MKEGIILSLCECVCMCMCVRAMLSVPQVAPHGLCAWDQQTYRPNKQVWITLCVKRNQSSTRFLFLVKIHADMPLFPPCIPDASFCTFWAAQSPLWEPGPCPYSLRCHWGPRLWVGWWGFDPPLSQVTYRDLRLCITATKTSEKSLEGKGRNARGFDSALPHL